MAEGQIRKTRLRRPLAIGGLAVLLGGGGVLVGSLAAAADSASSTTTPSSTTSSKPPTTTSQPHPESSNKAVLGSAGTPVKNCASIPDLARLRTWFVSAAGVTTGTATVTDVPAGIWDSVDSVNIASLPPSGGPSIPPPFPITVLVGRPTDQDSPRFFRASQTGRVMSTVVISTPVCKANGIVAARSSITMTDAVVSKFGQVQSRVDTPETDQITFTATSVSTSYTPIDSTGTGWLPTVSSTG